jgi:hypothetical protein
MKKIDIKEEIENYQFIEHNDVKGVKRAWELQKVRGSNFTPKKKKRKR